MSIDTFWWHTPKEALGEGQRSQHMLCLSMMDEATDYHVVHVVKTSNEGPLTNITGPEFRAAFSESWLKILPSPQILRFDEEGFLKRLDVVEWLEGLGIQLKPVAGESPWQIGKHSRHLQTVKENLCLLCTELHNSVPCRELLSLVMSAKNCMHNIRSYSPNQWAFGQEHTRVSSFLQTGQHLPGHSARADESFEESLQRQMQAQKMFLEVDARRRIQRALRAGSRPLKEFQMGELVYYYYRRGRKQGSRYGGHWYGPARVLCHEKYGADGSGGTSGAIVWVSHAGKILRCSPEQLKHVTQDLRRLDQEINGPLSFHDMLSQVSQQQRYLDISAEGPEQSVADMSVDETAPKFRIRSKRSLPNTEASESDPSQSLEGIDLDPEAVDLPTSSHGEVRRFQDLQGAPGHHPGAVPPLPRQTSTRQESILDEIATWSMDQVNSHIVEAGKYKHQRFSQLVRDTQYVKWVASHTGKAKLTAMGMRKVVACLHRKLTLEKGSKAYSRSSDGSQPEEKPEKKKPGMSAGSQEDRPEQDCDSNPSLDMELEAWNRIDETEVAVVQLTNRMDRMETVLGAILQELQKQAGSPVQSNQ